MGDFPVAYDALGGGGDFSWGTDLFGNSSDWIPADIGADLFGGDLTGGMLGGDLFYDTMTGQYVDAATAWGIDPAAFQLSLPEGWMGDITGGGGWGGSGGGMSVPGMGGGSGGSAPGGAMNPGVPQPGGVPPQQGGGGFDMNSLMRLLGLAGGLGAAGLGAAGVVQGQLNGPQTTSSSRTTIAGQMSPEQSFLQGILQNTGMQGLAEYGGLGMQQYNMLSALPGMAPTPDAGLNSMLTANAMGMAGGGLPALSPQLQAQLGDIYGAREQDIYRFLDQQSRNVREQMNTQGWEGSFGDVLHQGPGQALYAPALAEAVRQRGLLAGQQAQAEINLAQQLPQQAAQLGQGVWNQNLGANQNLQGIAGLFNPAMAGRAQLPQNLFNMQNAGRGTTTTETRTGPQPTLLDAFNQLAPILGGAGGTLYSYGQPQQAQLPINSGGVNPSGGGYI